MGRDGFGARLRRLAKDESGQALLEAALVLPVLLVLAFGVVAAGRVVKARVAVDAAAREAGRALAAAPAAADGVEEARRRAITVADGHGLDPARFTVTVDAGDFERGGTVQAEARYRVSLADLPLLGWAEVTVSSTHRERVELYRSRAAAP